MNFTFSSWLRGEVNASLLVMARGEHAEEHVKKGQAVGYMVAHGALSVVYRGPMDVPRRRTLARRGQSLLLINPGTYALYAEAGTLGFRGVKV